MNIIHKALTILDEKIKKAVFDFFDYLHYLKEEIARFLKNQKKKWKESINKTTHTGSSFVTFYSTLLISIQVAPIVLSALALLSTVTLFNFLLPSFLFEPLLIIPLLLAISLYSGYCTYKDLIKRARLDKQIKENKHTIDTLFSRVKTLEEHLIKLNPSSFPKGLALTLESTAEKKRPSIISQSPFVQNNQHEISLPSQDLPMDKNKIPKLDNLKK